MGSRPSRLIAYFGQSKISIGFVHHAHRNYRNGEGLAHRPASNCSDQPPDYLLSQVFRFAMRPIPETSRLLRPRDTSCACCRFNAGPPVDGSQFMYGTVMLAFWLFVLGSVGTAQVVLERKQVICGDIEEFDWTALVLRSNTVQVEILNLEIQSTFNWGSETE